MCPHLTKPCTHPCTYLAVSSSSSIDRLLWVPRESMLSVRMRISCCMDELKNVQQTLKEALQPPEGVSYTGEYGT